MNPTSSSGGFWALFATQFQGAFSDNLYRFLVIFHIMAVLEPAQRDPLIAAAMALFALPFLLFSMAGGHLADRFSKRSVAIGVKLAEIAIMGLATLALALGSIPFMLLITFLMSTQSAFFSPTKYGLLPELLPEKRLSWGNGLLNLGTFVAIISGSMAAAGLSHFFAERPMWSGVVLVALACAGTATSLGITRLPAANPGKIFRLNFLAELGTQYRFIRQDRILLLAIIGASYFWFLAAVVETNLLVFARDILGLEKDIDIGYMRAALAIGIGLGSFSAGYLSGRKIEYGLVPLGAIGLTGVLAGLSNPALTVGLALGLVGLAGFFGGFYIVPLNALIQHRPESVRKGSVIATETWLSFMGVFIAAGVFYVLTTLIGLRPTGVFLAVAAMSCAAVVIILRLLPNAFMRLVLWLMTHSVYRIRVEGRDNIPDKGGALLVCNHISLVDALLLIASTDRHIRFLMYKGFYERPWIKPFARILGAIPISAELRPREMLRSLNTASQAIRDGHVVCIFAEGQMTRIGQLLPFRRGFERIMRDVDAPIIPVSLEGVWGSVFSFEKGRFFWKWPRRIPYPVTVSYGTHMPATSSGFEVRQAVQRLNSDAWRHRKRYMKPVHRAFISNARRHPLRLAMAGEGMRVRFGRALGEVVAIARALKPHWREEETVGLLLPQTPPAAQIALAAMLAGKIGAQLDPHWNDEELCLRLRECGIGMVITTPEWRARFENLPGVRCVTTDRLPVGKGGWGRVAALVTAWLLPVAVLERLLGRRGSAGLDEVAAIAFSRGRCGAPGAVQLTHYNLVSNVEQLAQTFAFGRKDRVLATLPFSAAPALSGALCVPAVLGIGGIYNRDFSDPRKAGELAETFQATVLLSTPAFLERALRGATPEQFGSFRVALCGGEKLRESLAEQWEEYFGLRPFEVYTCTECSGFVAVNTRDYRAAGFRQVGAKRGRIGHPLPGVSICVVAEDEPEGSGQECPPYGGGLQPLPCGERGRLLIRGPNVMEGYWRNPERTQAVRRDGWFVSHDFGRVDEDGFLELG